MCLRVAARTGRARLRGRNALLRAAFCSRMLTVASSGRSGAVPHTRRPDALFMPQEHTQATWLSLTPEDTEQIGYRLGKLMRAGDTVLLKGKLGVGKTQFARGFVRGASGDDAVEVTSPTFLLDNAYATKGSAVTVHHMDLYRIRSAEDAALLGIPHVFRSGICIVEWPQRLEGAGAYPPEHLLVQLVSEDDLAFPREMLPSLTAHSVHAVPHTGVGGAAGHGAEYADAAAAAHASEEAVGPSVDVEEDHFARAVFMYGKGQRMLSLVAELERSMPLLPEAPLPRELR